MRTLELMIVFGALMAIVAVVAIAIDWVGKPLRGRRFIPRVYRFDDELEPVIAHRTAMPMATATPVPAMPVAHAPLGHAPAPHAMAPPAAPTALPHTASAFSTSVNAPERPAGSNGSTDDEWAPNPTVVSVPAVEITPPAAPQPIEPEAQDWDQLLQSEPDSAISGVDPGATQEWSQSTEEWDVSMPLDAVVNGERPTPIDKAERYWKSIGATAKADGATTHFDAEHIERMLAGRAPNRLNPRSARHESPELIGLRAASHPAQVQMFWPDEATDPWSAQ